MPEIILVRAERTCWACPSQWDAWDLDGRYWYLRYRSGLGSMDRDYLGRRLSFETEDQGGEIELGEFVKRVGVTFAPELAARVTSFEDKPDVHGG